MLLSRISSVVAVAMMVLVPGLLSGQDFPNRPIRIITSLPGGGSDFTARLIAQGISGPMGQPVVVENRPSSLTGATAMTALPDGYTLLVEGDSFWTAPLLQKMPYDVFRDFTPITAAVTAPAVMVVHPTVAVNSMADVIALAKAKPGQLNYGSSGVGGSQHLAMEMLKSMTGINIVHVPYKGSGAALTGIAGGEVQFFIGGAAASAPFLKSGKLKALAVTTAQPSVLFPGVPTIAATVPGYELVSWNGLFAAGKPPKAVVNRLNQEIARALNTKEIKDRFFSSGVETVGNTPEQFAAIIRSDVIKIGKLLKDLGIKGE